MHLTPDTDLQSTMQNQQKYEHSYLTHQHNIKVSISIKLERTYSGVVNQTVLDSRGRASSRILKNKISVQQSTAM